MAFERPSLQDLTDRILADFKSKMGNTSTFLRRSVVRIFGQVIAGAVHLLYGYLEYKADQLFATTADGDNLEFLAAEYGLSRRQAAKATGTVRATGTIGTVIPIATVLQNQDEVQYATDAAGTIGAYGYVDLALTAVEAGEDANEEEGVSLEFVSPVSGVGSEATILSGGIDGGSNTESDDDFRARLLYRKHYPPHGGSQFDYVAWALEIPGVTRAWCIPEYAGAGTVGLGFVRDGDIDPVPSDTRRQEMYEYLLEHTDPYSGKTVGVPVGAQPGFEVLDVSDLFLNPDISVYPFTDEVKASVQAELEDLIKREGGPGETVYVSHISEAVSAAAGEERHRVNSPAADVTATYTQFHKLGTIAWRPY